MNVIQSQSQTSNNIPCPIFILEKQSQLMQTVPFIVLYSHSAVKSAFESFVGMRCNSPNHTKIWYTQSGGISV